MKLYKLLFIAIGFIFLGIGMIGVVLPILPTTPFLLLASFCFVKGSDKFDRWFKQTQIYKNYAEDYIKHRSMTFKRKAQLMIISDLMLLFPLITLDNIYLRIFIILIVIAKYWFFIFKIRTKKD
jgi:uncharacterized membrane protein YbaN (DUF454 family)